MILLGLLGKVVTVFRKGPLEVTIVHKEEVCWYHRKFNGKTYHFLWIAFNSKRDAQIHARALRRGEYYARVVKAKSGYNVYHRRK